MSRITYVLSDGTRRQVDAPDGTTVMKNAVLNDVPGIDADCGGSLMCATCHVYVDESDADRIPPRTDEEEEMLEMAAAPLRETSRLSCQITVDQGIDGLTVTVPEA